MQELPELGDAPLKQGNEVNQEVAGFRAAAAPCGLRKDGRADLALIVADAPVAVAGVFTTNKLAAAPVQVCRGNVKSGKARAIVANSGGANAATGEPGLTACRSTCQGVARALGCAPEQVLPCSTGVIGQVLDDTKVNAALPGMAAGLSPMGLADAAGAIMTTDAYKKMARRQATVGGQKINVVGMAKGAGMIRPDMATMLCFVLTDAAAGPAALAKVLGEAVEQSFNRISVDGDTSTNDTVLLMASGKAGNPEMASDDPELAWLTGAVTAVCQDLAAMIVADGEGAGHLVRVRVCGAADAAQARDIAYAIAHSPLVKTALTGGDPNWGRILSTAGAESARRGHPFDETKCDLYIGSAIVAKGGLATEAQEEDKAVKVMARPRYEIRLEMGLGDQEHWVLTTDLTKDYIDINADYRS
ncbi:MAG: bifunctional glutamate N-acetyltransferase/amino-acid acetyltransferase ArgJ [Desulfarculaceae bacterium]|nr:bifunctional glutamate N-acetyltransferase/amino-acid acetyltransferase ArgJ [Desulfarculaceae bacterium]MCF8046597.1 bifunctional glutamate N-acetyltransferase/amino-acid acetyltransferase ArgJ [Desulfarculaceae bacterium]MCF8065019.1 bifunctional glutamate N-acetyltransferase/amino-acid acetyltransferase ArgJ [Desulfarculaceae bacterium]MCF8098314.1 bifunctional glutamate N-acetyltransferase/amino-acid acetyltransferase ArgJ [Desulfarculaceae bacterium]MCF8123325.1 bifunctional glutamate N